MSGAISNGSRPHRTGSRAGGVRRAGRASGALAVVALLAGLLGAHQALAVGQAHPAVVNPVPAAATPKFANGAVKAILQVGNRIIVGGTFTGVSSPGSSTVLTRNRVAAFDATTGVVDPGFVPNADGEVDAIVASADGKSVYIGGKFLNVNGVASRSLERVDIATGASTPGFTTPASTAAVSDLRLVGGRLYVAGTFTKFGTNAHVGLATVNPTTGAVDPFMGLKVAGHHNYPTKGTFSSGIGVNKFDISPDGSRMVAIGNFTSVSGAPRDQIVSISLTGAGAAVDPNWATSTYTPACYSGSYDSYMRGIQFAPDGRYFVVVTTGGYFGGSYEACDATARFESAATGADVRPTWVDYTGTDSLYTVAVTGTAIYVGGHERWHNNPLGQDSPGPGAVPRPGLAALSPDSGVPLSWNPGRNPRGHGAEALLATPTGLWVGSDTTYIGNRKYSRPRIAFFPLAGGKTLPAGNTGTLPGSVYLAGRLPGTLPTNVLHRVNAAGPTLAALDSGPDWSGDTAEQPSPFQNGASNVAGYGAVPNVAASVPASTPRAIFDSERWGSGTNPEMAWDFPATAGLPVQVRLYFANRYPGTSGAGQRVFDVSINGTTVLSNFDIVASGGDQTGTMKSFNLTVPGDGHVRIGFTHRVENPLINGIEIVRTDIAPPAPSASDDLRARSFDGASGVGATTSVAAGGTAWGQSRGAFMVDGTIFYGMADGNLYRRTFDGTTLGAQTLVDPYNDPAWADVQTGSGQTYRGTKPDLYGQFPNVTAMSFSGGRLYYTVLGDHSLRSRPFSPDSGIVGLPVTVVDSGRDWSDTAGMFVAGGSLYVAARGTGNLVRMAFTGGAPDVGSAVTVSGPGIDGNDWRARALFLRAS